MLNAAEVKNIFRKNLCLDLKKRNCKPAFRRKSLFLNDDEMLLRNVTKQEQGIWLNIGRSKSPHQPVVLK